MAALLYSLVLLWRSPAQVQPVPVIVRPVSAREWRVSTGVRPKVEVSLSVTGAKVADTATAAVTARSKLGKRILRGDRGVR